MITPLMMSPYNVIFSYFFTTIKEIYKNK